MTAPPPAARAIDLTKTFAADTPEPVLAVRGVSFELRGGEVTLLMGVSGGGKTTLLSMMGGLIPATSGDVEIAGVRLSSLSQSALTAHRLRTIGYVFQSFRLIDALSAIENVELVLNLAGMTRPASHRKARALLEQLGLGHRLAAAPARLSPGEKQRVAIARALANDPPLILADEPTGSLDSRASQQVIEILQDAARTHGRAVLIVSHDPRIRNFSDHVFEMEDGLLVPVEQGAELRLHARARRLGEYGIGTAGSVGPG
jgi:putative ABC transport system ATP-binding protein